MKKLSLALAAATMIIAAPAVAADLGRMPVKAPVAYAPAPAFVNWNGFYLGAQIGYSWGETEETGLTPAGVALGSASYNSKGVVGGGHVGYNFHTGMFLFGLEGDFEGSGVRGSYRDVLGNGTDFDQRWQASMRGRLGVTFNQTLLYVTGGGAWANLRTTHVNAGVSLPGDTFQDSHFGWTLGAGAEWKFAPNWSTRLEYRYTRFQDVMDRAPASFPAQDFRTDANFHTVRLGVSYHFGGGPIMASY